MSLKFLAVLIAAFSICFGAGELHAQEALCGQAPSLPTSLQNEDSIKGQLEGKADFLSKLVGKADLSGQVEAARKQLYQSSDRFFAAQKDAYLSYLFCLLVMHDNSLSTEEKLKALNTFKGPPPGKSGSIDNQNITIYAECKQFRKTPIPEDASYIVLEDESRDRPKEFRRLGYQCDLINYGTIPVFKLHLEFEKMFVQPVPESDLTNYEKTLNFNDLAFQLGFGPPLPKSDVTETPLLSTTSHLSIDKIGNGSDNRCTFYILNYSNEALLVYLPETITLETADSARQTVRLVHTDPVMVFEP